VRRLARSAGGILRWPMELVGEVLGGFGRVRPPEPAPPPAQRPVVGRLPEGVPPAALRPEPALPTPVGWPFG